MRKTRTLDISSHDIAVQATLGLIKILVKKTKYKIGEEVELVLKARQSERLGKAIIERISEKEISFKLTEIAPCLMLNMDITRQYAINEKRVR